MEEETTESVKHFPVSLPIMAALVAYSGLFAAAVLSAGHILNLPVPCGASNGCAAVAAHSSSKLLGVPIAFFGVAAYVAIIWLLTRIARSSWAPLSLTVITGIGAITSAILLVYAQLLIQATCRWCVASGVAMAVSFALSLYIYRREESLLALPAGAVWWLSTATIFALGSEMWLMQRQAIAAPVPPAKLAAVSIPELLATTNTRGPNDAPVKIIMFSDLLCSVCRALHGPIMNFQAAHPFRVQVIFRHRPLYGIRGHETSETAAILSEIAAEQGKFWRFVDRLYREPHQLDQDGYLETMRELGFGTSQVQSLLSDPHSAPALRVQRDRALADRLGVHLTPIFVVVIDHKAPVSANHRSLATMLSSAEVQAILGGRTTGWPR
jgi:protein-disulfide isomerase/uncharacterized membrane protein